MVKWLKSNELVDYDYAVKFMESRASDIASNKKKELIWLVEHPPLYTAGASAKEKDLLDKNSFPVYRTRRGGKFTYHGPGQRVAYVMLDLNKRERDVRSFVEFLERWIIATLQEFNIEGEIRPDRVGVWIRRKDKEKGADGNFLEEKIAAIGLKLRKWVSFHGISININPNLDHFSGIIPCGAENFGVTSFKDLGISVTMDEFDLALKSNFLKLYK
jgi:lipoyl(octanoyl) transferase